MLTEYDNKPWSFYEIPQIDRCARGTINISSEGITVNYDYPKVKRVIYNFKHIDKPATIVFWDDGTKTVVRCNDEDFTREGGIAQCYLKKFLGSRGNIQKLIESADIQG